MNRITNFIVLIERGRLRRAIAWVIASFALVIGSSVPAIAHAEPGGGEKNAKVARDLADALTETGNPKSRWARDVNGVRHVQVIVVSNSSDPEMSALREHVLRAGGAIHAVHPAVHAMTVQIKANLVNALSKRSDVVSVSPNRSTGRTASTLEQITGSLTSNVRSNSTKSSYVGLDGTNIGIAVLDSGVMREHWAFADANAGYRVKRNVNMLNASLANWVSTSNATSPTPGSAALTSYENSIANDTNPIQDAYGHGTHVASVAASLASFYEPSTPDTTGIAPNASIFDVKVLDGQGTGTVSDAIEGIQWVIYHAKEYNIRVLNVSLATDSTETWQTDPLCIAVRSATAAGITVVVAAGNYGLNSSSNEVYGRISAPGNDPSVITVGAANYKNARWWRRSPSRSTS